MSTEPLDGNQLDFRLHQLHATWTVFQIDADAPIHLRAIAPAGSGVTPHVLNRTFTAERYPSLCDRQEAFEAEALRLNLAAYNVYTCVNPIRPDFTGNETNMRAVSDADIRVRRLLMIDIDRVHAVGPIHEDEIDEVLAFAWRVETWLHEQHGFAATSVFSGNGVHLYLPLADLPNDKASKEASHAVLQALAKRFDDDKFRIDTATFNAGRITKVPGTVARKGKESEGREHLVAQVIE
jgi:hypothetical protein